MPRTTLVCFCSLQLTHKVKLGSSPPAWLAFFLICGYYLPRRFLLATELSTLPPTNITIPTEETALTSWYLCNSWTVTNPIPCSNETQGRHLKRYDIHCSWEKNPLIPSKAAHLGCGSPQLLNPNDHQLEKRMWPRGRETPRKQLRPKGTR